MKFQAGNNNNPAGRPVIPEQLKTTLKEGFTECIQFWFDTLRNPESKWEYRNKSAENISNYGYGKPKESIDVDMTGKVEGLTIEIVKKLDNES